MKYWKNLRILIGFEFSGRVRDAFIKQGFYAVSCDIIQSESPGPHIHNNIKSHLKDNWDVLIAFPPCTYLCNSGVRWLFTENKTKKLERWTSMYNAIELFKEMLDSDIEHICVENPIQHKYAREFIRKYDQTIQPWQFGHPESKRTCLWLKNLPKLKPENVLQKPESGKWDNQTPSGQNKLSPGKDRGKKRSITYQGIADAMANQWGHYLKEKYHECK